VYCSVAEGFGLPVVESVMAGVPCLTSRLGSMQEIADQLGGCSLVNPYSTSAIAAAVLRLLSDREELARLTAEAREARWHSWRDYCEQLMAFATGEIAICSTPGPC
jgi:glycosyltransferase involved in cell wall biosynthesis